MDIWRLERLAIDEDVQEFWADFPTGRKKCEWLDAYMGLFKVDGLEGFLTVGWTSRTFPDLNVEPIHSA